MTNQKQITETLMTNVEDILESSLGDAIAWLVEMRDVHTQTDLRLQVVGEWEDANLQLLGDRPETDEELAERTQTEKMVRESRERALKRQIAKAKAELGRLGEES
jgi:hypothetical protein